MSGRKEYLAGQIQQAIPLLEKARTAGAHGNELFFMLGNSYLQAHQIPKARAAFADLYGVPRESGAARLFTAQMLMRLEFEDDAQAELEAALAHEPKLPEAHFMRARSLFTALNWIAPWTNSTAKSRLIRFRHGLLPIGRCLHAARGLGSCRAPATARGLARSDV